jgi:hypothetical protein
VYAPFRVLFLVRFEPSERMFCVSNSAVGVVVTVEGSVVEAGPSTGIEGSSYGVYGGGGVGLGVRSCMGLEESGV